MSGTHNGPSLCIHGKPMKRDTCDACKEGRNPQLCPHLTLWDLTRARLAKPHDPTILEEMEAHLTACRHARALEIAQRHARG